MTERQIRREARDIACELEKKDYVVLARVTERTDKEVCFIDGLLIQYGIEKVSVGSNFFLFFKKEKSKKKKNFARKARKGLQEQVKKYNEDMQKGGWNIVYW